MNENDPLPFEVSGGGKHDPNEPHISPACAMQLAAAGLIEGVVKGRIGRAVRWLHEWARPDPALCRPAAHDAMAHGISLSSKAGTMNVLMGMGVYRERLPEAIVRDDYLGWSIGEVR
jgi:hypothetical protein